MKKSVLLLLFVLFILPLLGAGCSTKSDQQFPPKPPIPGIQRSPAIDRLAP